VEAPGRGCLRLVEESEEAEISQRQKEGNRKGKIEDAPLEVAIEDVRLEQHHGVTH
jgi:hypothetical protein